MTDTTDTNVSDKPPITEEDPLLQKEHEKNGSDDGDALSTTVADDSSEAEDEDSPKARSSQPRPFRKYLVLVYVVLLLWLASRFKKLLWPTNKKPEIIYAKRYSEEFKYRPAASPIITETLRDGRIRLRGAQPPEATPTPTPRPKPKPTPAGVSVRKEKRKKKKGKKSAKRNAKARS